MWVATYTTLAGRFKGLGGLDASRMQNMSLVRKLNCLALACALYFVGGGVYHLRRKPPLLGVLRGGGGLAPRACKTCLLSVS